MKFVAAIIAAFLLLCSLSRANDWPQWRGPNRDGISREKVSAQWPGDGPKIVWHALVATGFSAVSIADGRAYTMGNSNDQEIVWCLDALTGKSFWKHTYKSKLGAVYHDGGPVSTPTIQSNRVFTISKWGDVFCLDAANGAVIWEHDFRRDGVISNRWGFAGSPLLWGDLVILNAGGAGSALDRNTGDVVWQNGTKPTGYASPTLFHSGAKESVLIFAAKGLVAVEPGTGHELWRFPWETGWGPNNHDPLICRQQLCLSSLSRGCALLAVQNKQPEVVYDKKTLYNHLCSGIVLGEYLYAFNGEATKATDLRCIHLPTGELQWTSKDPAFGSLICADGKLLILSEKGELLMADPSAAGFKPLARAQILSGLCWTPPVLANGLLYARNSRGDMVCLDLKAAP